MKTKLLLLLSLMQMLGLASGAEEAWYNGIRYSLGARYSNDSPYTAMVLPETNDVWYGELSNYTAFDDSFIEIPSHIMIDDVQYEVKYIGTAAFKNCKARYIKLPGTIYSIDEDAFVGSVTSLIIPEGVKTVTGPFVQEKLQLPHSLGTNVQPYMTGAYYYPSICGKHSSIYWNIPISALEMHQIESCIAAESQVNLYVSMTHDQSKSYPLTDKVSSLRGLGLWGADIVESEKNYVEVPIELNRLDSIVAIECKLSLPPEVSPISIGGTSGLIINEKRAPAIEALMNDDFAITLNCPQGQAIIGNEGTLFTLRLSAGNYQFALTGIRLTTSDGSIIEQANDTINVSDGKSLDITNVNTVINQMLGNGEKGTFSVGDTYFDMVYVDGGTFTMGKGPNDSVAMTLQQLPPCFEVTLDDYIIATTEVTQQLWNSVMGGETLPATRQRPQTGKTWAQWQEFIAELNRITGFEFRMPTEAEWEFAARGGAKSKGYLFSGSDVSSEVGWCSGDHSTTELGPWNVALLKPNELGLYDMSGNAWEWCQDWYGDYPSDPQTNPTGPEDGTLRVVRGGSSYCVTDDECCVYNRSGCPATMSAYYDDIDPIGLRLAMSAQTLTYDKACDYNNDGRVDIADVNRVINIMLGRGNDIPTGALGHDTAPDKN